MIDDYYSNTPKKIPFVPIAITGFIGSQCRLVASMIHQLTGLPLIDLEHWVEHKAGKSLVEIIDKSGELHMNSLENNLLHRALNAKPPGIIVLGENTLLNKENQNLINKASVLIYLEYDIYNLIKLLNSDKRKSQKKNAQAQLELPLVFDKIRSALDRRLPAYTSSQILLETVTGLNSSIVGLRNNCFKFSF